VLVEDLDVTAAGLGRDAGRYRRLLGPVVRRWDDTAEGVLGPLLQVPRHPLAMASLGARALPPATWVSRHWFRTDEAAALWAGSAAHALLPLEAPLTSAFAVTLHTAAHRRGWPVAEGGSGRIVDALVATVEAAGGVIECDRPVRTLDDLPHSRVVLFDLALSQVTALARDRLAGRSLRRMARFRHGPGSCKVDYALAGPVPWQAEACRRATTVHVGGGADEIARAEAEVAAGRHPERPFVLVAQQDLADPTRVPAGRAQLWAYCHVPAGSTLDMADAIEAQIERFAPGFRDLVLARTTTTAAQLEQYNESYVGGDITGGSHAGLQLVARPYPTLHPYRLPWDGAFLCSASAPPGAGVHGMAGLHAARDALRWLGLRPPGERSPGT
jgi:phytoene dehydrogenase-like protein